jgi:hypothetical protein
MTNRRALIFSLCALWAVVPATAQTLPLPAGAGFAWERVGDTPRKRFEAIAFDRGMTPWVLTTDCVATWLDRSTGTAGTWRIPSPLPPRVCASGVLLLGPHPPGGPARADTVFAADIAYIRRSVDGGRTWRPLQRGDSTAGKVVIEVPTGYPYAGRLLAGYGYLGMGYSDDRGDSWTHATESFSVNYYNAKTELLVLPPLGMLPGVASGRGAAASPGWPAGRVVASGSGGVVISDTGGASYDASTWFSAGRDGQQLALVRRPDAHPLGPGPRLLLVGTVSGDPSVSSWTSDDAGQSWQRRQYLPEPQTAPGYGRTPGLFALSEPGETDAGAGGRALAVIGLGHLYQTTDAGETWQVVGRAPAMNDPGAQQLTNVGVAEMGPDGRLYIGVAVIGQGPGPGEWLYRTTLPFAVVGETVPTSTATGTGVAVRPNPASGRVEVVLSLAEAGASRVVVVDALGREVAVVIDGEARAGETAVGVETGSWPTGVYIVRATAGAQTATSRFVVAR